LEDSTMRLSAIGLIVTLALVIFLTPSPSHAQSVAKMPRIGILTPVFGPYPPLEAFRQGLRDLGYVEGQSIALEYRSAEGQVERLPALAAELVRLKVDIILAEGDDAVRAVQHASGTIPIVFLTGTDPEGEGFVASLARPGGNTTGVYFNAPELMGKRLELLKAAVPGVTHVAYLWRAALNSAPQLHETERAARTLGVQLQPVEVREPYLFDQAFATIAAAHADALITQPSGVFVSRRTQLVDLAARTQLPGMFPEREFAEAGGLMAYGSSLPANFRRAATYVHKILQGAKPADLPVEQPAKFELVINLKTAKALGLTIPPTVLFLADEVIR
jgi:putative ABC transport system substrate-binding protein